MPVETVLTYSSLICPVLVLNVLVLTIIAEVWGKFDGGRNRGVRLLDRLLMR